MPKSCQSGYDRKVTEFGETSVTNWPKKVEIQGSEEKTAEFVKELENNLLQKCNYFSKRYCIL